MTITYTLGGELKDGIEFCLADDPDTCFTTDDDGVVEMQVPAETDVAMQVKREGLAPILWLRRTTADDLALSLPLGLTTAQALQDAFDQAGVTPDESMGSIVCLVFNSAGAGATLSPASGEGPFYGEGGMIDPSLDEFRTGAGWFFDVEPGEYEIAIEHPERECAVSPTLWTGEEPYINRVRVEAGRLTWGCAGSCPTEEPSYTSTREPFADAAACEDGLRAFLDGVEQDEGYPDCDACACSQCLDEISACGAEPGCVDVMICASAAETRCTGVDCAAADTCLEVVENVPGGTTGAATSAASAWGDCLRVSCPEDCRNASLSEQ